MTRQIALGAVIAFAVTVLALSVWEPRAVVTAPPAPVVVPVQPPPADFQKPFRPAMLRDESINRMVIRQPVMMVEMADAGAR